jgi:hypothetical protein
MTETSMESALWSADAIKVEAEAEPLPGFKDEGSPTDERASSAPVVADESVPADESVGRVRL